MIWVSGASNSETFFNQEHLRVLHGCNRYYDIDFCGPLVLVRARGSVKFCLRVL